MKRKSLTIAVVIITVLTIAMAFVINQELVAKHMYPQDALREDSNLIIRGKVTSIKNNYVTRGMLVTDFHIWRLYIQLNVTDVVWTSEDYLKPTVDDDIMFGGNSVGVGYDYSDNLQLAIGQEIECKGFFLGVTDSSYSFVLTVAPSINGSYLEQVLALGNAEITALSIEDWDNLGGLLYVKPFNVTLQNNGTHDVYGVTLNCKITGNQSDLFYNFHYADPLTNTLNVLHRGEKYSMRVYLETNLELVSKFSGCRLVVTLTLDDFVLDEWIEVL